MWYCLAIVAVAAIVAEGIIIVVLLQGIDGLQDELDQLIEDKYGSDEMWFE